MRGRKGSEKRAKMIATKAGKIEDIVETNDAMLSKWKSSRNGNNITRNSEENKNGRNSADLHHL